MKKIDGDTIAQDFYTPKSTMVSPEVYEKIIKGMRMAVTDGTCKAADIPGWDVCGKTGTAENKGNDHSVFMGFAPMKEPKIAIAVYVENGGFGAVYGVPIGSLLMEQYLNGKLSEKSEKRAEAIQHQAIHYGKDER